MATSATDNVISERAQRLLKTLIESYIRNGQPVGSRSLARNAGLDLSPATIRNVMADLEELGFVKSPHTSAGRVPTAKGYRLFVDSLLKMEPLDGSQVLRLKDELDPEQDSKILLERASDLLSEVTRMAGIVTVPRPDHRTLRRVEFLPLSDRRVLAILVINEQEVQNRIIHTARPYTASELTQASNYLSAAFAGRDIDAVRDNLVKEMQEVRENMNRMMLAAIEMADKVFEPAANESDYVLAGQTNLMGVAGMADVEKLRHLFEAFTKKRDILHLLDQSLKAEGVQIFIGEESGYQVLDECSVVTSPYEVGGQVVGVLGIIGPTRMAYERVIPIVDMTARLLSAALNRRH